MKPNHNQSVKQTTQATFSQQTISIQRMPIPSYEELEKLEKISPGIAQQFMDMAKNEQLHRHKIDEKEVKQKSQSQIFALVTVVIICGLSGFGFHTNHPTAAASIACSVIVASILAFLGRKSRPVDNKN